MSRRMGRSLLFAVIGIFVLLGSIYSVVVPPFEASDEKWHYPMVKVIADTGRLPVQQPGVETPWRQEGSQAPLYYAIGALATGWIDTSDMDLVRHLNPHAEAGASPDGNVNLVVHNPALERFPWQGTVLAVHIVRFLSVVMSAGAVYFTYRTVRVVLPEHPALALGAAAIHAFTPMVIFIAGSVNNDNLAVLFASLGLWMLVRLIDDERREQGLRHLARLYLPLGVVLGLGALTKSQTLALAPIVAFVVTVRAVRRRSWREFLVGGLATALPLVLIAGWWYVRNLRLYGDLTGLETFIAILGQRDVPADLPQLWRERFSFLAGYWGNFGGLNVPMADWVYCVLNVVVPVAGMGLVAALVLAWVARSRVGLTIAPLPFIVCMLAGLGVFIPWLLWARITWSSQGRLVFYGLTVWSMALAMGLGGWLPRRCGDGTVALFALFLLGLSIVAPIVWIAPAYAEPEPLTDAQVTAIPHLLEADFDGTMRLLGYDLETETVQPGGEVTVTLYWAALAPTERPYAVFVHLVSQDELLIAQRDTYPGLGLLSTTWLEPGFRWADRYVIPVPETAYAPDEAQIEVGLYHGDERLQTADGADHVRFGKVSIAPLPGEVPNPIHVNFGDRMALVGYDLDERVVAPGGRVNLTLYWRGLRAMETNYTVSTQLVDEHQRKAAQQDAWPLEGAAPTAAWQPGTLIEEERTLELFPDAAPGVYDVRVAVYTQQEGELVHVPVIPAGGEMMADHALLTKVQVAP